jgi:rhamnose transport system ATP-binding protein
MQPFGSNLQGEKRLILSASNIYKKFGATEALSNVDLNLHAGEVHCLVGENGAGKSTLAKIIAGILQPDQGTLRVDGQTVRIRNVNMARELGISAVYQNPVVFPDLNVTENLFAGRQIRSRSKWLPIINRGEMLRQTSSIFAQMGVSIDPRAPVASLSIAEQQLIEIAKALLTKSKILILDEPTASLSERETAALFSIIQKLVGQGTAVLFISHRLEEVFQIGHRLTVLRDGHRVTTSLTSELDKASVIEMMVGRPLKVLYHKKEAQIGQSLMRVEGWGREGVFADISFSVYAGEILGFAGLIGAGRTELARSLFGIDRRDSGQLWLRGEISKPTSANMMLRSGLAYVPEDRHGQGLILAWPVFENISLPILRRLQKYGTLVNPNKEREIAHGYVDQLSIRPPDVDKMVEFLSGGNQQKVLLAKWLAAKPSVLILDEPTRGIDVGAKAEVHRVINDLAAQGIGVILISSELPELLGMCDRILVFCEGRIVGAFSSQEASQEAIMRAATDYQAAVSNALRHGTAGVHPA